MSNSIWKTPDQKPDVFKPHTIMVVYEAHDKAELMLSTQYEAYTADRYINRWCYLDDLIAQSEKVEWLQIKVDLLEHNKNGWAKLCEQKQEQIQRLQKAVDKALDTLDYVSNEKFATEDGDFFEEYEEMHKAIKQDIDEIKQLIKGE